MSEAEQVARVVLSVGLLLVVSSTLVLLGDVLTRRNTGSMMMIKIVGSAGVFLLLVAWGIWP